MSKAGYDILRTKLGKQEVADRKELVKFFMAQGITCDPQTTSWCSVAINTAERQAGHKTEGNLLARSWLKYGTPVDISDAEVGDIVIFHFSFNQPWQGHVAYYVDSNDAKNTITVLGGNQHDSVNLSTYSLDSVVGIRRNS